MVVDNFKLVGKGGGTTVEVETNTKALRVTPKPVDVSWYGTYSAVAASGSMAAGLAANALVFSARVSPTFVGTVLLRRIVISAGGVPSGFTAGAVIFQLLRVRWITTADSGGTVVNLSGITRNLRLNQPDSVAMALFSISSTAALTAGSRTEDTSAMGMYLGTVPATGGAVVVPPGTMLLDVRAGEYPHVLKNGEGFIIKATVPATGSWTFNVHVVWDEVMSY